MTEMLKLGLEKIDITANDNQIDALLHFLDYLLEKNKVMNLTAIKEPEEVITKHFLDCAILGKIEPLNDKKIIDIGCGAGFPGIPSKILNLGADITLLDSLGKRIKFLQEFIDTEQLHQITAVHARAEEFAQKHREQYDIATSRAVAQLNVLAELSLPFVKVGGMFVAMKSINCDEELQSAKKAIKLLGGEIEYIKDYEIPFTDIKHRLVGIRKIKSTPSKYPRRFNKISAEPL